MVRLVEQNNINGTISHFKNGVCRNFKIRKILVTRLRFMGDIILTTPILTALKRHFPKSEIDYLAETPYIDLLQNHPSISKIFALDRALYSKLSLWNHLSLQWKILRKLQDRNYDLAIDLFGIPRSAWLLKLTKAPLRVGGCFRFRSPLYTHCFHTGDNWKTAIDFHNLSLKKLGIFAQLESPKIYLVNSEREWAKNYLVEKGLDLTIPIIGIQPGASWPAKIWPKERFIQLAKKIVNELHLSVFFTFGPGEEKLSDAVRKELESNIFLGDVLSLRQLAAVLSCLSAFVSNDCGPMHLAPAVGTPTLGIFGPSEPEIWFPYKMELGHRSLIKGIECRPCHQNQCPIQHQCMDWISVTEVFKTLSEMLANHGSQI